jgi:molybdenum cofactor cytidylyltransferase
LSSIDSDISEVFGLLLAAGRSRRFGDDKRRALLPCGNTLLGASLATARAELGRVWVVVKENDDPGALGISTDIGVVRSTDAELGMGHSLAAGIAALESTRAQAAAVLLADMPWIARDTLRRLVAMARPDRIVLPVFEGQRGHPVIIGRRFWPALLQLQGDQGAKAVIAAHPDDVDVLECDDAGVLRDADTPQALAWAIARG